MFELPIIIIGAVLLVVIGLFFALGIITKNYIKVSPNQAAIISARTRKLSVGTTVGYRQWRV